MIWEALVSIPFKRDMLSELGLLQVDNMALHLEVSIPFKRDMLSELNLL